MLFNIIVSILTIYTTSCTKLVEIEPPTTQTSDASIYETDASAISVLNGIYSAMGLNKDFATGRGSIAYLTGLSGDELSLYKDFVVPDTRAHYYTNSLFANQNGRTPGTEFWSAIYFYIFCCNSAIEGLENSKNLPPSIKTQLLGESMFLRAFFYFYLANLYGDVPLVLSSNYRKNSNLARTSKSEIILQVINDLKEAQLLLSENYLDENLKAYSNGTEQKVRPTKWAATALLSRIYLFIEDWANAEMQASLLIDNINYKLAPINSVFLKNSSEAIWQLQPVWIGWNTEDARAFIITSLGFNYDQSVFLSDTIVNSFEPNDQRKIHWVGKYQSGTKEYYFPFKYKSATYQSPTTEYLMVFRLAEQYLIRAESRIQLGKISDAQIDLNVIRQRAGLNLINTTEMTMFLNQVLNERKIELFSEWGHRWFDLKRTNKINDVMTIIAPKKLNGTAWEDYKQLYPLPVDDIQRNGNLTQNPGY